MDEIFYIDFSQNFVIEYYLLFHALKITVS